MGGELDAGTGRYRLVVRTTPVRLVAKTTLSGIDRGSFRTFRTVTARASFLDGLELKGLAKERGGSRTFVDKKAGLVRDVVVRWTLERVDPVLKGRVLDHLGRPVAGLRLLAKTTNPARIRQRLPPLLRKGVTDRNGRFAIDVFFAHWGLEAVGVAREGLVVEGVRHKTGIAVRFKNAPRAELTVNVYRLKALPYARLVHRYFKGDVSRYLAYVRERVDAAALDRALVRAAR